MKTCKTCQQELAYDMFTRDRTTRDGYYGACKACKRSYSQQRYREAHRESAKARTKTNRQKIATILNTLKSHAGCVKCSENSHPSVLEYHHLDRNDKDFNIGYSKSIDQNKLLCELAKCICLCANCHRKVHVNLLDVSDQVPLTVSEMKKILGLVA